MDYLCCGIVDIFDDGVELVGASALTGGANGGGSMGKSSISIMISRLGQFSSPVLNLERDLLRSRSDDGEERCSSLPTPLFH